MAGRTAARKRAVKPDDPWLSLAQAATALGENRWAVMSLAAKGLITVEMVAGRMVVSRESVDRLLAERKS